MKKLVSTHKYSRKPFDYTKEYKNRKREYEQVTFTGDFDDTVEGMRLWYAIRRLKRKF